MLIGRNMERIGKAHLTVGCSLAVRYLCCLRPEYRVHRQVVLSI